MMTQRLDSLPSAPDVPELSKGSEGPHRRVSGVSPCGWCPQTTLCRLPFPKKSPTGLRASSGFGSPC